ncbi:hypothetical protein BWZ29_02455 [Enterobacter cancerogenus]|nr:hypothetical protein BWZ29_02455 [Enterobacter cancerogenus]
MSTITKEFTKEQLQQIEAAAKEVMWPVVWSEKKAREHFSEKITPKVVLKLARIALASLEAEPVVSHIGSKKALDAIVTFIKSNINPTLKDLNEVSERLFQDNCHGLSNHVIEYIKKIGDELEELRSTQDTNPPAPATINAEPVARLWSHRKHASEVTLVRPEDDEKAEAALWSGWSYKALYAAPPAPVSVPDALADDIDCDDHPLLWSYNNGWNACRAAMLDQEKSNG